MPFFFLFFKKFANPNELDDIYDYNEIAELQLKYLKFCNEIKQLTEDELLNENVKIN